MTRYSSKRRWISDYGYDATRHAFAKGAAKLGVDQLDLLILHQPLPSAFDRTLDAYRALEKLLADGKVRAIGVSNFLPEHLDRVSGVRPAAGRLLAEVSVVPAVNQIELHPYFQQTALRHHHDAREQRPGRRPVLQRQPAAPPAATSAGPADRRHRPARLADTVQRVAEARGVPMAQIALARVLRNPGVTAPIVGNTKDQHLVDAAAAVTLTLTGDEIRSLEGVYTPRRPTGY